MTDNAAPQDPRGLYQKYVVSKADGSEIDPEAVYFVLRLDTDRHARRAAWAYAASIEDENPALALDLMVQCSRFEYRADNAG